jgi:hypothetical protein
MAAALLLSPWQANAASGLPNSTQFGYGARLDPLGQEVSLSIKASASVGFDWIGVDFDWAHLWPQEAAGPNMVPIDSVMKSARSYGLNVLLSISNTPVWARTPAGPDPEKTARLVALLSSRYSGFSLSIELFPTANTVQGWGAPADPRAYAILLKAAWKALQSNNSQILLVAAGLRPISPGRSNGDIGDLEFLTRLYEAGAADVMPVISIRLTGLSGEVMATPEDHAPNVLRRYEAIRQIMLSHGHANGLIWITGFTWPLSGATSKAEQSRWIRQAYALLRAQLYIGVAFFDRLNPPVDGRSAIASQCFIQVEKKTIRLHPALEAMGILITLDRTGQDISSGAAHP